VSIDIGTSSSGFAWAVCPNRTDQVITWNIKTREWERRRDTNSIKTPTDILIKQQSPGGKWLPIAFGDDATTQWIEILDEHEGKEPPDDIDLLRRFKMSLYSEAHSHSPMTNPRDAMVETAAGRQVPLATAFECAFSFMAEAALAHISSCLDRPQHTLVDDVFYIITVPAIWEEGARQFMLDVAKEAGLNPDGSLTIALESEVAAQACRVDIRDLVSLGEGETFLTVDAGGGTADFTVHTVIEDMSPTSPGRVNEATHRSGGPWGSTVIDQAFEGLVAKILGEDLFETFKRSSTTGELTPNYLDLMADWEHRKENFKVTETFRLRLTDTIMPFFAPSGINKRSFANRAKENDCQFVRGFLILPKSVILGLFNLVVDPICDLIRQTLDLPELKDTPISTIFVVGGFGSCPYLQDRIKTQFSHRVRVASPPVPWAAILRGAVIYGFCQGIVNARRMAYHVGERMLMPFDPVQHDLNRVVHAGGHLFVVVF
jgi:hypothetical protein